MSWPTDGTDPRALAQQLRRAEAYFRYALTGIVETDADWRVVAANPAAASILGLPPKALPGQALAALLPLDEAQHARFDRHLAVVKEQGIYRSEFEAQRPDGERATIEWTSVDLGDGATLHTFDDISERRAALEATERARRAAEDAAQAKSRFVANISHEIRTPLSAILGLAEIALRAQPPASLNRRRNDAQLARIKEAADLLLALLNQVLDFSRVEAGRIDLERVPFSLAELVARIRAVTGTAAEAKSLPLRVEVAPEVPAQCLGDPTRISQVLLNLLGNAVKFTAQGSVELRVEPAGAARVRFVVSDTGKGISREDAVRLFEPFTQADASTTRLHGGTGLGLAISKRLVEAMGGTIALQSAPGQGTTVTLELPLAPVAEDAPGPERALATPAATPCFRGRRIVLAEDTALNREWLAALLLTTGAEVREARDGREAVARALAPPDPDLVLMDMQMPRLDGVEAAREIRAAGGSMPIVALTANATPADRDRCLAAGMNAFLPKPFAIEALWQLLAKWLPAAALVEPINPRALADQFMNDRALQQRFAEKFLAAHGDAAVRIRAQLDAGAADEAARLAHSLKGAAALIGADAVAAAAGDLQRAIEVGATAQVPSLCDALAADLAAVLAWSRAART